ncbi:membrane-spanning 4-domains subfamily A member 6A-like [Suricata suricatta]|nr:membrane-spanning 4-domains subfamily A member 6A-like [Suricata suricatta]
MSEAIQILCGVIVLGFGIILASAPSSPSFSPVLSILLKAAYPFVGALCFVISGTLSVIMEKKSTKTLVQRSVAANILSSLCALVGFILLSVTLAVLDPAVQKCIFNIENREPEEITSHYYVETIIDKECFTAKIALTGTLSVMLIYTVLEFCVAMLTAVVLWKEAHSDFLGSVLFLTQSYKNKSSTTPKACHDPGYEELVTS